LAILIGIIAFIVLLILFYLDKKLK
jgi:hypothetical protein